MGASICAGKKATCTTFIAKRDSTNEISLSSTYTWSGYVEFSDFYIDLQKSHRLAVLDFVATGVALCSSNCQCNVVFIAWFQMMI